MQPPIPPGGPAPPAPFNSPGRPADDRPLSAGTIPADVDLDRVWLGVAGAVWARPVRAPERLVGRLLGSPGLARALLTTPSLVLSWVLASAAVLALGVLASRASETGTPWFALVAPAVAAAAIAHSYGPGVDPAFELSQTMAVSDRLVLLARGTVVFVVNAALSLVASWFVPGAGIVAWGWLVPMAAVSALALAVATLSHSANTGVATALAAWFAVVLTAGDIRTADFEAAVGTALIPAYLVATALGVAVAVYATGGARGTEARTWQ
jgi:hypothetical protein